jgi:hypothetical protein
MLHGFEKRNEKEKWAPEEPELNDPKDQGVGTCQRHAPPIIGSVEMEDPDAKSQWEWRMVRGKDFCGEFMSDAD